MADLDLDAIEELIQKDQQKEQKTSTTDPSKQKKEFSDDEDRKHRRRGHHHKSRKSRRHGSGSSSGSDTSERRRKSHVKHVGKKHRRGESSEEKQSGGEEVRRREQLLQKSLEEAKRQAEEAQRDDCTVLVSRINLNVDEKMLFQFFSLAKVGKIRDVRMIRDSRSGKSKGIAYVEFYTPESVLMAMAMSGQQLNGQTLMVQASQAEKNRQAAATKFKKDGDDNQSGMPQKVNTLAPQYHHARREQNNRVYVSGLVDALGSLTDLEIRKFFEPFGLIDAIDLPKDQMTGKNKGHAIIEFRSHRDAKIAVKSMHGFQVTEGLKLQVSIIMDSQQANASNTMRRQEEDLGEDTSNTYIHSAEARTKLMQQLMTRNGEEPQPVVAEPKPRPAAQPAAQPSSCLLFGNMFELEKVDLRKDPSFFIDIKDQVIQACNGFGPVDKVYIEQNSDGNVWVKYKTPSALMDSEKNSADALKGPMEAQAAMNKQYFDQRLITVAFVPEVLFMNKFKER